MPMRHVSYPCCPGSVLLAWGIALRLQAGRSLTIVSNQFACLWGSITIHGHQLLASIVKYRQ
jgi:hypothetical protein